jgi:hypothetical protein
MFSQEKVWRHLTKSTESGQEVPIRALVIAMGMCCRAKSIMLSGLKGVSVEQMRIPHGLLPEERIFRCDPAAHQPRF